jgi:3-oxoacyl-[acyl-carrier protein] reductase
MDLQLSGKTGLVVAGSKGLGRAVAEAWAAEGVAVAILARSRTSLDEVEAAIRAAGGKAVGIVADLNDPVGLDAAVAGAQVALGPIDLVLLNTGGPPVGKAAGIASAEWETQYRRHVTPLMRIADLLLPDMRARGFGRILYIGSPGVIAPLAYVALAQSMRAAMAVWLKTLAGEVGPDGVTVNTLISGMFETERVWSLTKARAQMDGISVEDHMKESVREIPVGRMGQPAEMGAVAAFLASPLAAYITGSLIRVDGGWIKTL